MLSDGLIELRVLATTDDEVRTEVVFGGELREHQGINLPGVNVSAPALTVKDAADLDFGLTQGIDYVAISFVRRAADVQQVKQRIAAAGNPIPVIAKIEKPEALDDLAGILEAADAIMVARGDLGVEMPTERVPLVQKQLIEAANGLGELVVANALGLGQQPGRLFLDHVGPVVGRAVDHQARVDGDVHLVQAD